MCSFRLKINCFPDKLRDYSTSMYRTELIALDLLALLVVCVQDEDTMEDVCKQIIKQWTEWCSKSAAKRNADDGISVTWIHPHY